MHAITTCKPNIDIGSHAFKDIFITYIILSNLIIIYRNRFLVLNNIYLFTEAYERMVRKHFVCVS